MNFNSSEDLAFKYPFYLRNAKHFVARYGYQGFVYTQISDIEHECNGWLTYDRRISKLPIDSYREIHQSLSKPIEYKLLSQDEAWLSKQVRPTERTEEPSIPQWAQKDNARTGFSKLNLPHKESPLVPASDRSRALGIVQELELEERPERAVLELRAAHKNAWDEPASPRLDGHQRRTSKVVRFVTFLDGVLHRRSQVSIERGQGEGVVFLEFTDKELRRFNAGSHTLAIEIQNPADTVRLDVKLWSYRE